jgi:hypothetical protein
MTGSKEMFEQEQERFYHEHQDEPHYDELPGRGPLPVLDMNTLSPDEGIIKLDKDTLNLRSTDIAMQIIASITDGFINPLEFAVKKKLVVDALEMVMKDPAVKRLALEEVQAHGKEGCTKLGAKITTSSRSTYQYDKDPKWSEIKAELKPLEEKLKAQEEKIKAACKNNASLVSEEGEIIASIVPAPATESISVSFSKK